MTEKEIEVVEGIIDEKKISEGDNWTRTAYVIKGKTYSTFDTELKDFKKGQSVTMTFVKSKDGKYNNITDIKMKTDFQTGDVPQKIWAHKDIRMTRMNALTNANALIQSALQNRPDTINKDVKLIDLLLEVADTLESWVYRGLPLEE